MPYFFTLMALIGDSRPILVNASLAQPDMPLSVSDKLLLLSKLHGVGDNLQRLASGLFEHGVKIFHALGTQ